ncbi:hypothetical protein TNCV_998291 [Trichonephila clavipes]|nr:hypothetical protein TNCV_998291 [Trichonephila clavipes]
MPLDEKLQIIPISKTERDREKIDLQSCRSLLRFIAKRHSVDLNAKKRKTIRERKTPIHTIYNNIPLFEMFKLLTVSYNEHLNPRLNVTLRKCSIGFRSDDCGTCAVDLGHYARAEVSQSQRCA